MIPLTDCCIAVGLIDDEASILGLQIRHHCDPGFLRRQGQNLLVLLCIGEIVAEEMLAETPDGRQPAIARRHGVAAPGFQVRQKSCDRIDPQVGELQVGDRASLIVGKNVNSKRSVSRLRGAHTPMPATLTGPY